jgi:hypothetical protein
MISFLGAVKEHLPTGQYRPVFSLSCRELFLDFFPEKLWHRNRGAKYTWEKQDTASSPSAVVIGTKAIIQIGSVTLTVPARNTTAIHPTLTTLATGTGGPSNNTTSNVTTHITKSVSQPTTAATSTSTSKAMAALATARSYVAHGIAAAVGGLFLIL